jgi:hypothetical protein
MSDNNEYGAQHSVKFSEVTWYERLRKIAAYLPDQVPLFAAVTVSFWGVAEVISEIGGEALSLRNLAAPALATALVISVYKAIQAYVRYVPEVLANENFSTKRVYRQGKSGWQFALAREMLLERISAVDRKLKRVESGAQFIPPTHLPAADYLSWLQKRPELLQRLIRAVAVQCTTDLPKILAITTDEATLADVKDAVEQLALLYEEAANFELEVRSVKPPEHLASVHRMTFGWSDPIRDGIAKFVGVLDAISNLNVRRVASGAEQLPDFAIAFESPPNLTAFGEELGSLGPAAFR